VNVRKPFWSCERTGAAGDLLKNRFPGGGARTGRQNPAFLEDPRPAPTVGWRSLRVNVGEFLDLSSAAVVERTQFGRA
jgi:hypothetical protein